MNHRAIGNFGEKLARRYLLLRGYKIVESNYQIRGGEMDIVARKSGWVHFVEVKYRENTDFGNPEDAMSPQKLQTLYKTVQMYCLKNSIPHEKSRMHFLGILKLENPSWKNLWRGKYEWRFEQDIEIG